MGKYPVIPLSVKSPNTTPSSPENKAKQQQAKPRVHPYEWLF